MAKYSYSVIIVPIILVLFVLWNSLFIVEERERAVLLRLGRLINVDIEPGLHFKIPVVDRLIKMEGRILTVDLTPQRYLTNEQKALIVDSYVQFRINDVSRYYTSTSGDLNIAKRLLDARVDTGLRNKFGERSLQELVSGDRDGLMSSLTEEVNLISQTDFGIDVVDIRIKRIDLPDEVSDSVFERMNTERHLEAREIRAEGTEAAELIRAEADKARVIIESEAIREAQQIKGEGDAEAANIYASAYDRDRNFYNFYRKLQAYETSFANQQDLILLSPQGDFLDDLR